MTTWMAGATYAAALSLMLVSTPVAAAQRPSQPQSGSQGSATGNDARARGMLSGCVVRDAVNGGRPTIASNGISYMLIGRPDDRLDQYLGKRVEVIGTLQRGSASARATSGDATGAATDRPTGALPLVTSKGTTDDLTGRVQVKSIRIVAPTCLR